MRYRRRSRRVNVSGAAEDGAGQTGSSVGKARREQVYQGSRTTATTRPPPPNRPRAACRCRRRSPGPPRCASRSGRGRGRGREPGRKSRKPVRASRTWTGRRRAAVETPAKRRSKNGAREDEASIGKGFGHLRVDQGPGQAFEHVVARGHRHQVSNVPLPPVLHESAAQGPATPCSRPSPAASDRGSRTHRRGWSCRCRGSPTPKSTQRQYRYVSDFIQQWGLAGRSGRRSDPPTDLPKGK